jgi:inorganic pyrophosphatase
MTERAPRQGIEALSAHDDEGRLLAVIEAPRGSANKLKFDPRLGVFVLHNVLPLGTMFPFDFGFVPGTLGGDGDPLDVLVLMDEPAAPGVVVPCGLLGVVEAVQRKIKDTRGVRPTRNDRLVAVAAKTHRYANCRTLGNVGAQALGEIERFFVFYNAQKGVRFTPTGRAGRTAAKRLVSAGCRAFAAAASAGE